MEDYFVSVDGVYRLATEEEKAEAAKAQAEWEQAKPEPTAEERLEAVENAVLALMGGPQNV